MAAEQLSMLFKQLKSTYFYSTKFIVDSDDIEFVRQVLLDSKIDMHNIVFLENIKVPETLVVLSLCNAVVCNGRFCIGDRQDDMHADSTYG